METNASTPIVMFEKEANSVKQLNILYSIGYLVILSQIGCFVPAKYFATDIYDTLISKMAVVETT